MRIKAMNKIQNLKRLVSIIFFVCVLTAATMAQTGGTVTVISRKANLRGTPSQTGLVMGEVTQNAELELITVRGGWYLVQTPEMVGWLHGNTIKLNGAAAPETYSSPPPAMRRAASSRRGRVTASAGATAETISTPTYRVPSGSRSYIRGPRGGCYYLNSSGRKTYVDRSLCN